MSANVQPEEIQAILGSEGRKPARASDVRERDFERPRRLGESDLEDLRRAIEARLAPLADELAALLSQTIEIELVQVSESTLANALDLGDQAVLALGFEAAGRPGWLVWEREAAVRLVERALGSKAGDGDGARRLSPAESDVVAGCLHPAILAVGAALEVEPQGLALFQDAHALGPGSEDADPHRIDVELSLSCGSEASSLHVYLPDPRHGTAAPPASGEEAGATQALELAPSVQSVSIDLCARMDGCEVSLSQLLAIEEGDVIPLESRLDDGIVLTIEDRPFAPARLGSHRGRLAVRIEATPNPTER